jgi:hypothetical protein
MSRRVSASVDLNAGDILETDGKPSSEFAGTVGALGDVSEQLAHGEGRRVARADIKCRQLGARCATGAILSAARVELERPDHAKIRGND